MKMNKWLAVVLCALTATVAISGCGKKEAAKTERSAEDTKVGKVDSANPIYVDKEKKSVTVLGEVNGKYLEEGTRHFMVSENGKYGDKSIIRGLGDRLKFYDALNEIGAKAGENMRADTAENTHVEGDKLKVTVTWNGAGKDYDINEVVVDSNRKPIDMRFGGNLKAATEKKTGCIACLDSCPVGIVSNHTYTYGAVEKRKEVKFWGDKKVLPGDGTPVAVTFRLEK